MASIPPERAHHFTCLALAAGLIAPPPAVAQSLSQVAAGARAPYALPALPAGPSLTAGPALPGIAAPGLAPAMPALATTPKAFAEIRASAGTPGLVLEAPAAAGTAKARSLPSAIARLPARPAALLTLPAAAAPRARPRAETPGRLARAALGQAQGRPRSWSGFARVYDGLGRWPGRGPNLDDGDAAPGRRVFRHAPLAPAPRPEPEPGPEPGRGIPKDALDESASFERLVVQARDGASRPVPSAARAVRFLLVPGFGWDLMGSRYFSPNLERLRELGLDARFVETDPLGTTAANAERVRAAIEASPRPVVILGHSKGGIDTLRTLELHPGLAGRVRTVLLTQSPYFGTPWADWWLPRLWLMDILAPFIRLLAFPRTLVTDPRGWHETVRELSRSRRRRLGAERPLPPGVELFAFASRVREFTPWDLLEWAKIHVFKALPPHGSDGIIVREDAIPPGARYALLDEVGHLEPVTPDSWKFLLYDSRRRNPYYAEDFTEAVVHWIFTGEAARAAQPPVTAVEAALDARSFLERLGFSSEDGSASALILAREQAVSDWSAVAAEGYAPRALEAAAQRAAALLSGNNPAGRALAALLLRHARRHAPDLEEALGSALGRRGLKLRDFLGDKAALPDGGGHHKLVRVATGDVVGTRRAEGPAPFLATAGLPHWTRWPQAWRDGLLGPALMAWLDSTRSLAQVPGSPLRNALARGAAALLRWLADRLGPGYTHAGLVELREADGIALAWVWEAPAQSAGASPLGGGAVRKVPLGRGFFRPPGPWGLARLDGRRLARAFLRGGGTDAELIRLARGRPALFLERLSRLAVAAIARAGDLLGAYRRVSGLDLVERPVVWPDSLLAGPAVARRHRSAPELVQ